MQNSTRQAYRKLVIVLVTAAACGRKEAPIVAVPKDSTTLAIGAPDTVLFIGTSITAGFGLPPQDAWVTLIQQRIDSAHLFFRAVNAGVSGETSADALHRLDWMLSRGAPRVIVLETGANDALRGQQVDSIAANVDAILARLTVLEPRAVVVVAAMEALPNLGARYGKEFRAIFTTAAAKYHAIYLPFLLDHVAGVDTLNQADGIHPNRQGSVIVADNVWRTLKPLLDSLARTRN